METKFILESLLFSAQRPLSVKELREIIVNAATDENADDAAKPFKGIKTDDLTPLLEELSRDHEAAGRSYRLVCVAEAWQFVTQPEYFPWLKAMMGVKNRPARLTQAALETLAIIAYRQPITRAEVEQVRGVNIDGTMQTLLERGLVEQSGRAEIIGRPALYSTTSLFLEYFGLPGLDELPAADELRRIPIEKPVAPITADAGLATAGPEQLQLVEPSPEEKKPSRKKAKAAAAAEPAATTTEAAPAELPVMSPSPADAAPETPAEAPTEAAESAAPPEPAPENGPEQPPAA
ncbi:MAG TPA: SMC-Scp complex subunit ScpB [Verrucomicrobiae bacterium]